MADIKVVRIESLPATTAVTEDDYLVVQQPDLTRRVKIGDVVHVDGTVSHVISFKEGGKLNGPMDFAYFEEEDLYLRWKGEFPHTVPALSSPYSDGGITDAAWMVYTDPSLREELESTIGASMIMTAEGQSVQDVMDVTVQTANDAKALAQLVDFGTVHTVGDVIHLDNFVGPAVIEEGRTTNYPSAAAGEKFLNGVVSRRDTTTVDGIFRGATTGAMYTIAVTNGVATTKRIALRDEFKRLEANNPTRTVIRAGDDLNTAGYLQLDATGRWGMWNQQTASWQPLAIEQGGTGARDAAGVRINIGAFYKQRAALEPNFNINNLTGNQDGVYYQPMTAYATEANGYPAGSGAGTLIVYQNTANQLTGCVQEYITYFGDRYTRAGNTNGEDFVWEEWRHDAGKGIQLRPNYTFGETSNQLEIHVGANGLPSNADGLPKDDAVLHYWGNGGTGDRPNVLEFKVRDESQANWVWHCGTLPDKSRYLSVNGAVNCTSVNQSSDRDLKDNITVIPDALEAIRKMKGYTYTLKENGMPYAGVIAQEVLEALPEAVSSFVQRKEIPNPDQDGTPLITEERFYSVDYAAVTGLLVQVCREQDDKITALEEQVKKLTEVVTGLQEKLK